MAKRGRDTGDEAPAKKHGAQPPAREDGTQAPGTKHRTQASAPSSIRESHDDIDAAAQLGRAQDRITRSTGHPHGTPDGQPTRIPPEADHSTQRSIEMENSAATFLAGEGWRIKQNPSPDEVAQARHHTGDIGSPTRNPDYLLEGRVFDCYSPTLPTKSPRGIWGEVEDKVVERQQTQRVVVNLEDWRGDLAALRKQFADWPIEGLKEVKVITNDGEILQLDLPDQSRGM